MESRLKIDARERPIHRVEVFLPEGMKIEEVTAPGEFQWALTRLENRPLLTIYLAAGKQGETPIFVRGRASWGPGFSRSEKKPPEGGTPTGRSVGVPALAGDGTWSEREKPPEGGTPTGAASSTQVPLPVIEIRGMDRQEGDIAVQADPVFEVEATGLANCESVLRDRVRGWLKPEQYAVTPLALHYRRPDYSGRLRLALLPRIASCDTTTNVRITDRAVEETVLLDFNVEQGGLREIAFLLPAWMHDSRIDVPLLRQKTLEPAQGARIADPGKAGTSR